jgi:hypothetical protein
VIVTASNYGGARHPSWCYNLIAYPECELHIGPRGRRFVAREIEGAERDRLFASLLTSRAIGGFGGLEAWDLPGLTLPGAIAEFERRLPVNAPLDGKPWCGSVEDDLSNRWAWGTADDMVHVTVIKTVHGEVEATVGEYPSDR